MKSLDSIKASLAPIFKEPINFSIYLGFGASGSRQYRLADLDDKATSEASQQFLGALNMLLGEESLQVRALSSLDYRSHTLYFYDLDDKPKEFAVIAELLTPNSTPLYSFKDFDFSQLKTIVLKVSTTKNSVLFVKQFFPVSLVKRDQLMLVLEDDKRFTTVERDILRITSGFEMLVLDGEYYVGDINKLERTFGFDEVTERQKQIVADAILALPYVSDIGGHIASLDVPKRDVLRAKNSPVLALAKETVLAFVQSKSKQLGLKVVDGKIQLKSRASVVRFIKLLNDDYLVSELTRIEYETAAKDKLTEIAD